MSSSPRPWPAALLAFVVVVAMLAGCGDDSADSESADAELSVVATTTQVADLVRNVGGERVGVRSMLASGADPHDYEPRPSDAAALADTPVVFKSGGDLDEWLDSLIENAGGDAQVVQLIDSVKTIEGGHHHDEGEEHADEDEQHDEEEGEHSEGEAHAEEAGEHAEETDPHWWQNPRNSVLAVAAIRDALIEADPDGREVYNENAAAYTRRLERLDAEIAACIERVPADKRKIVTTHDALGYFADRYGIEVIGSVIPSLSTQAQPSAKDVEQLVTQIEDEGVEALFPESGVNQRLERALSREAGAEVGAALWADTLGQEGSKAGTYIGATAVNTQALVEGMSGGQVSCRPDVR